MTVASLIANRPFGPRSLLRRFFQRQALLMSLFDQAMVSGFSFIVGILTARVTGIQEFGRYVLVLAFAAFVLVLHDALFAAPMMSFAGRRARRSQGYYSSVALMGAVLAGAGGIVVAVALVVLFGFRDGTFPWAFAAVAGLLTVAQCLQLTARRMSFAQGGGIGAFAMDLGRAAIFAALLAVALIFGFAINATTIIGMLAVSSFAASAALAAKLSLGGAPRRMLRATAAMHWSVARWLVAVPLLTLTMDTVIWIMTGILFGDDAVGGVRAAQYLFGPILVLSVAMENMLPLRATAAWTGGGVSALRTYLLRTAVPLGLAYGTFLIVFIVPAEFWLDMIFGSAFTAYAGILRVFGLAVALSLVRNHMIVYFRAVQETRPIFNSSVVSVVAMVIGIVPVTTIFGLMGVALAALIGQATGLAALTVATVRHFRRSR